MDTSYKVATLEAALADLVVAVHEYTENGGSRFDMSVAMEGAVEALGQDPRKVPQDYLVSIEILITATDPEEAVREYQKMLEETLANWVYTVKDENEEVTHVDTYGWKR